MNPIERFFVALWIMGCILISRSWRIADEDRHMESGHSF